MSVSTVLAQIGLFYIYFINPYKNTCESPSQQHFSTDYCKATSNNHP